MHKKIRALAKHLIEVQSYDGSEIKQGYDENHFEYGDQEYLVVTNDEADELWEEDLENYIEECILCNLPEPYRYYFDNEKWKGDAKFDGRGHSLSSYDGCEYEQEIDGETYYIYRTN